MGAARFEVFVKGTSAREAFDEAVRRAQYEHGHGGYTGTIAEKRSYKLLGNAATLKEARALADEKESLVDDKWGPAGCIAVGSEGFLFFGWASS